MLATLRFRADCPISCTYSGAVETALVRTYPLHEARAEFSRLVERALNGEPQRVTRYGREAVVIVSEADWAKGPRGAATLVESVA